MKAAELIAPLPHHTLHRAFRRTNATACKELPLQHDCNVDPSLKGQSKHHGTHQYISHRITGRLSNRLQQTENKWRVKPDKRVKNRQVLCLMQLNMAMLLWYKSVDCAATFVSTFEIVAVYDTFLDRGILGSSC
jgi:hypothetical protein